MDLEAQYDWLASNFSKGAPHPFNRWATRPHLDPRRGVTVIGRFSTDNCRSIRELLRRLRVDLAGHLVYPDDRVHLTVVVLVPAGYRTVMPPEAYIPPVCLSLQGFPVFSLRMEGPSSAGASVILRGFPLGDDLEMLRAKIRSAVSSQGLPNFEGKVACYDGSQRLRCTAHVTLARLSFSDENLKEKLSAYSALSYGRVEVSTVELVRHDEFLTPEKCRILFSVELLESKVKTREAGCYNGVSLKKKEERSN
jgi:2'-5' RNA ligase